LFPGTFEYYTASIIAKWQDDKDRRLGALGRMLEEMGLTWKVRAAPIADTQYELKVGRLLHSKKGGARDMVSIADVGFGVSQMLPVMVSLLAASPGQLVYLEQPEIHLHPKAQRKLAHVLADAIARKVIVVVETHSSLLLQAVQTLVARDEISEDDVKLHWFKRCEDGSTKVISADLDKNGAFGDWPEDFDDSELEAESDYLDAVAVRKAGK
jgi:predicted ATPase